MRVVMPLRRWSMKTINGRWCLEPGVPKSVPHAVATAALRARVTATALTKPVDRRSMTQAEQ